DAVGAAVDLRGADLHELDQARLEAGADLERGAGPDLHDVGGGGEEINLGSHRTIPFMGSDDMTSGGPPIVTSSGKEFCLARIEPPGMASNPVTLGPPDSRQIRSALVRENVRLSDHRDAHDGARLRRFDRRSEETY